LVEFLDAMKIAFDGIQSNRRNGTTFQLLGAV